MAPSASAARHPVRRALKHMHSFKLKAHAYASRPLSLSISLSHTFIMFIQRLFGSTHTKRSFCVPTHAPYLKGGCEQNEVARKPICTQIHMCWCVCVCVNILLQAKAMHTTVCSWQQIKGSLFSREASWRCCHNWAPYAEAARLLQWQRATAPCQWQWHAMRGNANCCRQLQLVGGSLPAFACLPHSSSAAVPHQRHKQQDEAEAEAHEEAEDTQPHSYSSICSAPDSTSSGWLPATKSQRWPLEPTTAVHLNFHFDDADDVHLAHIGLHSQLWSFPVCDCAQRLNCLARVWNKPYR